MDLCRWIQTFYDRWLLSTDFIDEGERAVTCALIALNKFSRKLGIMTVAN